MIIPSITGSRYVIKKKRKQIAGLDKGRTYFEIPEHPNVEQTRTFT